MKLLFIAFTFFLIEFNSEDSWSYSKSVCCSKAEMDSLELLKEYAKNFHPGRIGLNDNISEDLSTEVLNQAIHTNEMEAYKHFMIILLKQLQFHLKCCNQSYNLNPMAQASAGVIINHFAKKAGPEYVRREFTSSWNPYCGPKKLDMERNIQRFNFSSKRFPKKKKDSAS